ncbi:MAG: ABC transporter ATP-binding protein [Candidatus Nanopelagicales bacterium]
MTLAAHVVVDLPPFTVDLNVEVAAGETLVLLGPNGAGKTTALRSLAGLVRPDRGRVALDGVVWDEPASGRHVAAEHRPIGLVFQDYLLFPHLSALDNVAFGPRCHGAGRAEATELAATWLERVGLAAVQRQKPRTLSGGQSQRVALARALAVEPRLLLLDEPLAALDARTRLEVRSDLRRHLGEFAGCALVVTHDPLDAMVLGDRLVVVEHGSMVQSGSPAEIAKRPRTDYVARLVGLNLFRGRAHDRVAILADGGQLTVDDAVEGDCFVSVPPTAVALFTERPDGTPRNVWPVTVVDVELHGGQARVLFDGAPSGVADVTPSAIAELGIRPGDQLWAGVKATETHAYPA